MTLTEEQRIRWLNDCLKCKKHKPQMKNARCPLSHALKIKSPVALENIELYEDLLHGCKLMERYGE